MAYPPEVERWRGTVEKYFPPELVDKALHVIMYESGGNPSAVGDNGAARGLFQIQDSRNFSSRPDAAYLDNPENNIKYAAQNLGAASGKWTDWGEGTTYNGQVFGALGNYPYQGPGGGGSGSGPLNGRASVGAGITGGGSGNTYGIYNNLSNQSTSGGIFSNLIDRINGISSAVTDRNNYGPSTATPPAAGDATTAALIAELADGGSNYIPPDHFFDISPGDQRDFDESVLRDRRDFDYNASMDSLAAALETAKFEVGQAQQKFDNAMAVGDFKAAQAAQQDLNHWKGVEASQESQRLALTNQGQQLDYNLGLGNIAANRYGTDADIAMANARNQIELGLGQQQNQTGQFDAETARQKVEQDFQLGMANATTEAERVALEERRRQDTVAIANMEGRNTFTLGQQQNQLGAVNADTDRMRAYQNYQLGLAGLENDRMGLSVRDLERQDSLGMFNTEQLNQFLLGQQGNQTNQFGAETDRANRMGTLALENNKFIAEQAYNPRNQWSSFFMQRGVAPDWDTILAGGTPASNPGGAMVPSSVMNAYTPVTAAPTFNLTAAQAQAAQAQGGPGANGFANKFLDNSASANTATTAIPQFNEQFQAAQGAANSNYDSSQNQFIGQYNGYKGSTAAPTFNLTAPTIQNPTWTGPDAVSGFLPNQQAPAGPPKTLQDVNPGGLQGGVPLAALQQGLNLSTVGGGDIKGSDFSLPSFYDSGMTQRINPEDVVKGGSQVYTWYGNNLPGGGQPLISPYDPNQAAQYPHLAAGGVTTAPRYVTGDDPETPDGLGKNAELNEPQVGPNGEYLGTRVTPLNPGRRALGQTWDKDGLAMAAGFGLRPKTIFSKR